jgi:hypothetical protein
MTDTRPLVLQSHRADAPRWIRRCLESVRDWAEARGYAYRFEGDEALARVPDWYRDKAGAKRPVVADLARLSMIREALEAGHEAALWLDADCLVFAPERFNPLAVDGTAAVGWEIWVDADPKQPGRLKTWRGPHNACLLFRPGDPRLDFLIHATRTVIAKADPARIAPQMVGPKLLKALQPFADFALLPEAGAFSPPVLRDLAAGGGAALDLMRKASDPFPAAANLCLSLADDAATIDRAVDRLLQDEEDAT